MYDITRPGYEINKIKDKSFGVISSIHDNSNMVGLTSYSNCFYLLDPKSNEYIWKQQVGPHGLHEIIYDTRNLQSEVTHVERISHSQQVLNSVYF